MADLYERAHTAVTFVRGRSALSPVVGIILGSGLGGFGAQIEDPTTISYAAIPHFPRSTVAGHSGNLILGTVGGVAVAVMEGRVHAYEGYAIDDVVFPTRVLGVLGCRSLIVTNAAGAINPGYPPGSLVAISDHINFTGTNAASGPNESRFAITPSAGQRFFDMGQAYSSNLRSLAHREAKRQGMDLGDGVYLAVLGPSFETPAEIRAFRTLGADLVGMSTVHEVIVARHMGMEVLGLSLATNPAAGLSSEAIDHLEVIETGRRIQVQFTQLLASLIPEIAQQVEQHGSTP